MTSISSLSNASVQQGADTDRLWESGSERSRHQKNRGLGAAVEYAVVLLFEYIYQ